MPSEELRPPRPPLNFRPPPTTNTTSGNNTEIDPVQAVPGWPTSKAEATLSANFEGGIELGRGHELTL